MRAILVTLLSCLLLSTAHARTALTANTTFYVNGDAVNSQTCGLTGGVTCGPGSDSVTAVQAESNTTPFLTLQAAINAVLTQIDWNGFRPTINLAHGSSTNYGGAECTFPQGTSGSLWIQGDDTDRSAVTITALNSSYALYLTHYCIVRLRSVTVADQGSSVWGLEADNFGGIDVQNVSISTFSSPMIRIGQTGHLELVTPLAPETDSLFVNGSAPIWLRVDTGGNANFGESNGNGFAIKFTVHIAAGLTFSTAFIDVPSGATLFNMSAGTFTGNSYTGTGAILNGPGFLQSSGVPCATIFSASSGGCVLVGGFQDDANDVTQFGPASVVAGTLANGARALNVTATLPDALGATNNGVVLTVTSAGNQAPQAQRALRSLLAAGYTGSGTTEANSFANMAQGMGTTVIPAAESISVIANSAAGMGSSGITAGANVGGLMHATSSTFANVAGLALAQVSTVGQNIAFAASAYNTSGGAVAGWFSLNQQTVPSGLNAVLVADNASQAAPIFLGRANGATKFTIDSGGNVLVQGASFGLSGGISASAWTTAGVRYKNVAASYTDTSSGGAVAAAYTDLFAASTISASSATTYTNYYGSYFQNPVAGTFATFTNKYAIGADSLGVVGGTLAAGANALNITATQPASPVSTQSAINITVTGPGSAAQNNLGFVVTYAAGYTGPNRTAAGNFSNSNAGTAGSLPASGSNTTNSNAGLVMASNGTTSGWNIGSVANAANGARNFGFVGIAQIAKDAATNVGLAGYAINTGTMSTQIGVLASLNPAVIPSSSAALIADNGSQGSAVALFQVAGVTDVFIGATGGVVAGGANADEGAGTVNATTYYGAGTAGVTCPTGSTTPGFATVGGIVTHC
jgi:hypothetical protein